MWTPPAWPESHSHRGLRTSPGKRLASPCGRRHSVYQYLDLGFAEHEVVQHSKGEYVRGEVHTNSVEELLQRSSSAAWKGVYQHCSEKHLHRYLAEFDFRYSEPLQARHRGQRAHDSRDQGRRRQATDLSTASWGKRRKSPRRRHVVSDLAGSRRSENQSNSVNEIK